MNKCPICQTEFDGEVCTSCAGKEESGAQTGKGLKVSNKAYKATNFLPAIVFVIFATLMVVFMALLPVAKVDAFGLNENYGTLLSGTRFDEIAGLNNISKFLLVFSLITVLYAVMLLTHRFSTLKYRKFFGKPLYKLLEVLSIAFIMAFLISAILIIDKINGADEGLGIIRVSYYPILTIILSVVCLLVVVISIVLCNLNEKANPEILENWKEERQKAKAEAKASRAKKITGKAAGFASKRFFMLLLVPVVIFIASTGVSGILPRFEDKTPFSANDLRQILVKDEGKFDVSKFSIEAAIGESYEPDGNLKNERNVVYYTENYLELLGKLERNQKYSILAIEQADYRISGLLKQAINLEIEQQILAYGKAEITYSDNDYIKEVVYNNIVIDNFPSIAKILDNVLLFRVEEEYSDLTQTKHKVKKVVYLATYTDGSFIYRTCENVAVVLEDGTIATSYEGSYVGKTLRWQDEFGQYEVVAR